MKKYEYKKEHFKYYKFLEALRKSGDTNMFGATPYLMERFSLKRDEASNILAEWMDSYDELETILNFDSVAPLSVRTETMRVWGDDEYDED